METNDKINCYLMFGSRKAIKVIKQMVPFLILLAVAGCSQDDNRDPFEKETSILLNKAESSAVLLQQSIEEIDGIKRYNTPERMATAIHIIEKALAVLDDADKDIHTYLQFIKNNKKKIKAKGLERYSRITDLFTDSIIPKREALKNYFKKMKAWLAYSHKNFEKLKNGGAAQRERYERLLYDYHNALERYNTAQTRHLQFVKQYVSEHPELAARFKKEYKIAKKELNWD